MTIPIKLFTVHAQLCGRQLICDGGYSLPVADVGYYSDGIIGYFTVEDTIRGLVITNYVKG